jgi:hypothetical protein
VKPSLPSGRRSALAPYCLRGASSPRSPEALRARIDRRLACAVVLVVVAAAWLDRHAVVMADRADVFTAIWAGIQIVASWLGTAGAAIATSLEGVVSYLVSALAWLGGRVADILTSTGAMFARVWDGVKIVWTDVLKPALTWIDTQLTRLQAWLKQTFAPVFKWLQRVRDELTGFYKRFVRPVVDTIEFIRQLNRVLLIFHIDVLKQLDATLAQIEQRIEEPILWLNAKITELQNIANFIVTADGFFQRLTLLRSMSRYAPSWMRIATAQRTAPISNAEAETVAAATTVATISELVDDVGQYFAGGESDIGPYIDAALEQARAELGTSSVT